MTKAVKRSCIGSIVVIGLCLCLFGSAYAHTMWLNVTDYSPHIFSHPVYSPEPQAKTVVYFGWGDRYPIADFLSDKYLDELFLVSPNGDKEKLTPGEGGFRATQIKVKEEGGWMVTATIKPAFYHKIESEKKGEGDFYKRHYAQYAKALINVGEVSGNPFLKPVGHKIEIIPLKNPNELELGDWFSFKVLLDGEPAKRAKVRAASLFSFTGESFATYTSSEGEAKIRVLRHYGPWIVRAEVYLPPTEELKDKCEELHYTATLTFEVQ